VSDHAHLLRSLRVAIVLDGATKGGATGQ
jgi:hypothetical protein